MPANPFTWRSTKPGAAMPRPFGAVETDRGDAAAVERDVARDQPPVDEGGFDAEPHGSSAARTTPPVASSRARAASTSTTRAQRDDRDLRVAVRVVERSVDALVGRAGRKRGRSAGHARAACRSSRRRRPSGCRTSSRGGSSRRRDHVEHELLRRAGLEPRRAGDDLAADHDRDLVVGERAELRALDATRPRPSARRRDGPPRARRARTAYGRWR